MRQTEGEEEEEGCCLFEGLISFGKEGDGFRDENGTSAIRLTELGSDFVGSVN